MTFLQRFLRALGERWRAGRSSRIGTSLGSDTILSNFLTTRRAIRRNGVHSSAFMPRHGELSTFQTQGLHEADIWQIAVRYVLQPSRRVHGRAENPPEDYLEFGLRLTADNQPPRHVNAANWPTDKDDVKEIALVLASKARLVRCVPPKAKTA